MDNLESLETVVRLLQADIKEAALSDKKGIKQLLANARAALHAAIDIHNRALTHPADVGLEHSNHDLDNKHGHEQKHDPARLSQEAELSRVVQIDEDAKWARSIQIDEDAAASEARASWEAWRKRLNPGMRASLAASGAAIPPAPNLRRLYGE